MPWWENSIIKISADGMIHTIGRERPKQNGRKDIINEITYKDAYVCLTCPYEECSGERDCFLRRKKELEEKNETDD